MKKKSIVIGLIFVGLMLGGSAVAISGAVSTKTYLSLINIYDEIAQNNLDVALLNDDIDLAYEELEDALDVQYDSINGGDDVDKALIRVYNPKEAQMDYDHAIIERDQLIDELEVEAETLYYEYILMKTEIDLKEKEINNFYADKEDVEKEVELGLKTSSDVVDIEKSIASSELDYNQLLLEQRKMEMDINILINHDLDQELYITEDPIPTVEFEVVDMEADIDTAIALDQDLQMLLDQISMYKEKRTIYKENRDDYETEYDTVQGDIDVLSINMVQSYADIEFNLRSQYNTILNAETDIKIAEIEIANIELDIAEAEKRYELGLVTVDVVDDLKDTLETQEFAMEQLELEYYLAVQSYNEMIEE